MRILFGMTSLGAPGGIASVNRNIVRALTGTQANEIPIELCGLVLHDSRGGQATETENNAFRLLGCESKRLRFAAKFLRLGLQWRPDLVLIDHLHLAVIPYLLRRVVGVEYALFCHGTEFDGPLSRTRKAAYRRARLRLSNSHFTANRLMSRFPGLPVEPCELGIEESADAAECTASGLEFPDAFGVLRRVTEPFVLIVSRVCTGECYKGHDELIEVMPELLREVPAAQFIVAGDGNDLERLREVARASGAGNAILFAGFVSDAVRDQLFARCRVFAMPSRGEGFGLVYLEAMRFAKPCIASPFDGGSEVVVDKVTGFHVDPTDFRALRQALVQLLRNPALAEQLGRAGLDRLNRHYRFDHFRERLFQRLAPWLAGARAPDAEVVQSVPGVCS
jgi:glycosyltransferase involved in cell wall biosynthesis